MQEVGYAALQIIPSFNDFERRVDSGTRGPLAAAGRRGGSAFGDSAGRSMVSSISSHARHAAYLAGGIISAASVAGIALFKGSMDQARESQKIGAITAQVIKSTGGAANETAKEVGNLSSAISQKVGIDDEAIEAGANMVLTFKNVRNEVGKGNHIFDQAVGITTDLAAAMAQSKGGPPDLKSSAILVGKALQDPVKGLTALHRVGVDFTAQQVKQITGLVKHNELLGAQKIILGELQSEFGGTAKAQATMGDKVSVAWGNIEEKLGKVLLPLVDEAEHAVLTKAMPAFRHWITDFQQDGIPTIEEWAGVLRDKGLPILGKVSDSIRDDVLPDLHDLADVLKDKGIPFLEQLGDTAKPLAHNVIPLLGDTIGALGTALGVAAPLATDLVKAFNSMPAWARKDVALGGLGLYAGAKTGLLGAGRGALGGLVGSSKPIPVFVTNAGFGAGGAGGAGDFFGGGGEPGSHKGTPRGGKLGGAAGGLIGTLLGLAPSLVSVGDSGHETINPKFATPASAAAWMRDHPVQKPSVSSIDGQAPSWMTDPVNVHGQKGSIADLVYNGAHIKAKLDGYDDTAQQIMNLRKLLAQPVTVPVHPVVGGIQAAPSAGGSADDILDHHPVVSRGGVVVNVGKIVAQDYRDMQRQLQHRAQRAQMDGVRSAS